MESIKPKVIETHPMWLGANIASGLRNLKVTMRFVKRDGPKWGSQAGL